MATRHVVAKVGDIPVGGKKLVSVKGRDIGVFNVNGEFFALLNKCPHAGASLCHGPHHRARARPTSRGNTG